VEIIPVIDLLQGQVARAQRGERSHYLPIQTSLRAGSDPADITDALLELYPFKTLYIADLDAIQGRGSHARIVCGLAQQHPQITFWVDSGIRAPEQWEYRDMENIRCVIGSESLETLRQYHRLMEELAPVLSLDFGRDGFIGATALLEPNCWPENVICMTLSKVGSYEGADVETLTRLLRHAPQTKIYAAGGIRDADDLQQLKTLGITGALVASSLHDGRISASEIARLMA
jgi:phosphoribosylformimino-5-aminoimidazole carboxamide ribotide isomerase